MLIVAPLFLLPAVVGLVLLWRGLRPPREGDTPYCRGCGYNLTGANFLDALIRCPECGAGGPPGLVAIRGERRKRPRKAALGAVLLLAGLTPLVWIGLDAIGRVNTYRLLPTSWLLDRAGTPTGDRARAELEWRRATGRLSAEQQDQLCRLILSTITMRVRQRIDAGAELPYEFTSNGLGSRTPGYTVKFPQYSEIVDGEQASAAGGSAFSLGGSVTMRCFAKPPAPGAHTFRWTGAAQLFAGSPSVGGPIGTQPLSFDAAFEVLPVGAPSVNLVRTPELDAWALRNIEVHWPAWSRPVTPGKPAQIEVRLPRPMPVGFSFDVLIESGDTRTRAGGVSFSATAGFQGFHGYSLSFAAPSNADLTDVRVLLLCNPQSARLTVDIHEIWGGSLEFPAVDLSADAGATVIPPLRPLRMLPETEPSTSSTTAPAGE